MVVEVVEYTAAEVLEAGDFMVADLAVVAAFAAKAVTAAAESGAGATLSAALAQEGTGTDSDGRAQGRRAGLAGAEARALRAGLVRRRVRAEDRDGGWEQRTQQWPTGIGTRLVARAERPARRWLAMTAFAAIGVASAGEVFTAAMVGAAVGAMAALVGVLALAGVGAWVGVLSGIGRLIGIARGGTGMATTEFLMLMRIPTRPTER
jgi:VIT1/CCC1 family predicted Fe2+/Mn2+ transporter